MTTVGRGHTKARHGILRLLHHRLEIHVAGFVARGVGICQVVRQHFGPLDPRLQRVLMNTKRFVECNSQYCLQIFAPTRLNL